ncbi:MAG TPA: (2Fe-2S)-binding protein [Candidatus Acidoferrales bacterium]|nr:(2Fe-2S)-binding protein [Candidatus Acidoferrales bacterium]
MPERIYVTVNGTRVEVPSGTTALAAVLSSGTSVIRRSVTAEPRGPLCGMGICFECRATVNGQRHCRTCQILCTDGMELRTDE